MPDERYVRILYTVNGSSQYILARSLAPVAVNILSQKHATVSFKFCLQTLCRSSPDLLQDAARDYSVYVLDPLESGYIPEGSASSSTSSGVAVALGSMSWALHSADSDNIPVTGTLLKLPSGQDALEVLFSLRETTAAKKTWIVSTPTHDDTQTRAAIAAAQQRSKDRQKEKEKKRPKHRQESSFKADLLLGAAPKLGRKPKVDTSSSSLTVDSDPKVQKTQEPSPSSASTTRPLTLPDILALLSMTVGDRNAHNAALLAALHTIDGPSSAANGFSDDNKQALVEALKELLAASPSTTPPDQLQQEQQDDEIVVLDKENVNPQAFRRRGDRDKEPAKTEHTAASSASAQPFPVSHNRPNRGLSANSTTNITSSIMPEANAPITGKRTLSDFLEEHESRRYDGKEGSIKRSVSEKDPLRYYSRVVHSSGRDETSLSMARTSPPRPSTSSGAPTRIGSSPPRRRPFVVPEWARTGTATKPRLSAEKQAQLATQHEEVEEMKKHKERAMNKQRYAVQKLAREKGTVVSPIKEKHPMQPSDRTPLPQVMKAASTLPVFASSDVMPLSAVSSSPRAMSPPRTPPRKRRANTVDTHEALFTPSPRSRSLLHEQSPLFSPSRRASPSRLSLRNLASTEIRTPEQSERSTTPDNVDEDVLTLDLERALEEMNDAEANSIENRSVWRPPPSSPLPPSSPPPISQDIEDEEDVVLPPPLTSSDTVLAESEAALAPAFLTTSEQNSFGLLPEFNANTTTIVPDDDIFSFLNFDTPSSDATIDPATQNGLVDFDFTQFWETVKPLVESNADTSRTEEPGVADQVHALFSGCLL